MFRLVHFGSQTVQWLPDHGTRKRQGCIENAFHRTRLRRCGGRTGLIGGGIHSPIILAQIVSRFSNWSAPLYLTGLP